MAATGRMTAAMIHKWLFEGVGVGEVAGLLVGEIVTDTSTVAVDVAILGGDVLGGLEDGKMAAG